MPSKLPRPPVQMAAPFHVALASYINMFAIGTAYALSILRIELPDCEMSPTTGLLTGTDLETHMRENIFGTLGPESFTFKAANVQDYLWPLSARDPATGRVVPFGDYHVNDGVESALGGQGPARENGRMFKPQLGAASKAALLENLKVPSWFVGDFHDTKEYDWGLGSTGNSHPYRKEGTLIWGGAANIFGWIDRETGVAGVFGTQIMPAGELVTKEYIKAFENEVYAKVKAL